MTKMEGADKLEDIADRLWDISSTQEALDIVGELRAIADEIRWAPA